MQGIARRVLSFLLIAASMAAVAGTPHLTLDINTQRAARDSNPVYLGKLGNSIYFIANDVPGASHAALFKTDATDGGTTKVKDIGNGGILTHGYHFLPPEEKPTLFISTGRKAYFVAWETSTGQEVWVTDGTVTGTHMVADVFPGPNGNPLLLGLVGTDLIFVENTSAQTWQIFKTDGTGPGTVALTSFPASSYGILNESVAAGGKVYMSIDSMVSCCQPDLWVTDGTAAGTRQISGGQAYHLSPSSLTVFGKSILFVGVDPNSGSNVLDELDVASDTIQQLAPAQFNGSHLSSIAVMDGFALFVGRNSALWRTDGTGPGTSQVKAIGSPPSSGLGSQDTQLLKVGNHAIFLGNDGVNGPYIWSSDGTDAGTVPLIAAGGEYPGVGPQPLFGVVGTHGYFAVFTNSTAGENEWQLAVTDGTQAGTHVLGDVGTVSIAFGVNEFSGTDTLTFIDALDNAHGFARHLFSYSPQTNTLAALRADSGVSDDERPQFDGTRLFFKSSDPVTGQEPWISDGTAAGTHLIHNVMPESLTNDSNPNTFVDFGGQLAFLADDGVHGVELWVSDGTSTGTRQLPKVNPGNGVNLPSAPSVMNGAVYFFALDGSGTSQLMRVDNPDGAAQPLAPLTPMPGYYTSCSDRRTAVMNGKLYFAALHGSGYELFKTDGTPAGTVALTNLSTDSLAFMPCSLTTVGDRVYFTANTATGAQLWVTDGTSAGTVQVSNVSGSLSALNTTPAVLNGQLYFTSFGSMNSAQLWKTDGTPAGTMLTATFPPENGNFTAVWPIGALNGTLLLEVQKGASAPQLWISDGTQAGSMPLSTQPLSQSVSVTVIGSKAYFAVQNSPSSSEPWVTDGTQAGTFMLKDTDPQLSANPVWYQDFYGVTVFEVSDSHTGSQLYRTDGTTAGTQAVGPIGAAPVPGRWGDSRPHLVAGQILFFPAVDADAGAELFALPNNAPVAAADSATSAAGAAVTINVLANDTDSDGTLSPASIRITTNPAHGTVTVSSAGSAVYTPTAGFTGQDTFAYTVADNQGAVSAPAQVTVEVQPTVTVSGGSQGGGGGTFGYLDTTALLALMGLRAACRRRSTVIPSRSGS